MYEKVDNTPLCCCEYIDHHGERNHILACCCNCVELDQCCDSLVTCQPVSRPQLQAVMGACLDRLRCPSRGGASLSYTIVAPFIAQPLLAMASVLYFQNIICIALLLVICLAFMARYMAQNNAHSQILYYWTISSILYTIILFESSVTPLLEIRWDENLVVVLLTMTAIGCFYGTRSQAISHSAGDRSNGVSNGVAAESICPVCRIIMHPRCVHCSVCQLCVSRYDHHCFWLDCCVGEFNQFLFMVGLISAIGALVYGSLLTLTTICRPVFKYGVLVPSDCSDVTDDLSMGLCYFCAVYCLGLAILLTLQLLHHTWLVSRGISGEEWRQQNYSLCTANPYSRGCCRNWIHLFRGVQKSRH